MYLRVFLLKVTNFKEFGGKFWPEKGENWEMAGRNLKMRVHD